MTVTCSSGRSPSWGRPTPCSAFPPSPPLLPPADYPCFSWFFSRFLGRPVFGARCLSKRDLGAREGVRSAVEEYYDGRCACVTQHADRAHCQARPRRVAMCAAPCSAPLGMHFSFCYASQKQWLHSCVKLRKRACDRCHACAHLKPTEAPEPSTHMHMNFTTYPSPSPPRAEHVLKPRTLLRPLVSPPPQKS